MDASQRSDLILSLIRKSNLNFSLTESPFSVSILIKKSFIKNKDGSFRTPTMEQSEFQGSQHLLRNSQHHGMHLPQHVDAREGDPPQVPLISQNDQNPEQVLSPNTYFPPPNLQKIPKNPTIHTPYHPAPEAAHHQVHAIHHQADLPLHQGLHCDLVHQQDLRQLSEEYSHHHSLKTLHLLFSFNLSRSK